MVSWIPSVKKHSRPWERPTDKLKTQTIHGYLFVYFCTYFYGMYYDLYNKNIRLTCCCFSFEAFSCFCSFCTKHPSLFECAKTMSRNTHDVTCFWLARAAVSSVDTLMVILHMNTLGARGFLREEPRSAVSEAQSGEERENRWGEKTSGCPQQLIDLTVPIDLN